MSDFKEKYKGKTRERYNKAIRAEVHGGNQVLDLLELINIIRNRGTIENPQALLNTIEERIQEIRTEMVEGLRIKHNIP